MFFNCKAQTITNLHNPENYGTTGYYYKDLNNDLNNFNGTWKYENGNTSLIVTLQKKENKNIQYGNTNYYTDAIIGEYVYIENGIEKINTLENLNNNYADPYKYNLIGDVISKFGDRSCSNCETGNIIIRCSYKEPECDIPSNPKMRFRYYIEDGVEKLDCLFMSGPYRGNVYGLEPQCQGFSIPFGEYTLIKQ